jgi:UDP-2,4-diacetamido-2,4,6-trideoxy-beta-L-altropyranose hydrolase
LILPSPTGVPIPDLTSPKHLGWLEVTLDQEMSDFKHAIDQRGATPDWVVMDHYSLEATWQSHARSLGMKVLVIDDLADRRHDCDLLLDQSYFRDPYPRYTGLVPEGAVRLLGPRFSLLREEFSELRARSRARDRVQQVCVTFGSSDQTGATAKVLEALVSIPDRKFKIRAVIGANDPDGDRLRREFGNIAGLTLSGQVKNFGELLIESDLYIGAGGTTTWERFCLGLPGIILSIADNQELLSQELSQVGLSRYLGKSSNVSKTQILESVEELCRNPEILKKSSEAISALVDGAGANRVIQWLEFSPVRFRPVQQEDAKLLWEWANDPSTRATAFDPRAIDWETHLNWFRSKLGSSRSRIYIAIGADGTPLGQIRFDFQPEHEWMISFSVDSRFRSLGLGTHLLRGGVGEFFKAFPDEQVVGFVKDVNPASKNAFLSAGFTGDLVPHPSGERVWKYQKRDMSSTHFER